MKTPGDNPELKRRIRNNALLLGGVALLFFIAFIAISALR
jgi:hypothetical protein